MDAAAIMQFGNLASDVYRCISALDHGNLAQYKDSLENAYKTLKALREAGDRHAYEEGVLMVSGLTHAKTRGTLMNFKKNLNVLLAPARLTPVR